MNIESENIINKIKGLTNIEEIGRIIEDVHPVDFLEELKQYEDDYKEILNKIPVDYLVTLLDEAEIEDKIKIYKSLSNERKIKVIKEISSDELVDMIQDFEDDEKDKILNHLDNEEKEEIKTMLTYDSETAGGIMATEFLEVKETMTMDQTIDYLRKMSPDYETPYYVYVIDDDRKLKGVVQLRQILTSDPTTLIKDEMIEQVISVPVNSHQEDVARLIQKYGFAAIPVTDDTNRMVGIITFDDIMPIIEEENTEDMYRMAGLDEEEEIDSSISSSVKSRVFWLILNLFTAIFASTIIGKFENTISSIVALATLMPIVSGMGGNAATQTLTLVIRSIALGEVKEGSSIKILVKEIAVSIINGVIVGALLAIITYFWIGNIYLGLIIMAALIINIIMSAVAGTLIPIILKKIGQDPALSSSVFVTTITDSFGFGVFLSLATIFMNYLV